MFLPILLILKLILKLKIIFDIIYSIIIFFVIFSEQRCDGFIDCNDATDEINCKNIVKYDELYEKSVVYKQDKSKINCFLNLTILDVISIDDNNNMLKPTFEISVEWVDHRLQIINGKKGNRRLVNKKDLEMIWLPAIMLNDINQNNRYFFFILWQFQHIFLKSCLGMCPVQRKFSFL